MNDTKPTLAVIGGTGDLGSGLAKAWAKAGYHIVIGSRSREKAVKIAGELSRAAAAETISGDEQAAAASKGDILVVTVPYASHHEILNAIKEAAKGKILIDATVPLRPPKVGRVQLPEAGCAAVEAQQLLGGEIQVVSAFQNLGAHHLHHGGELGCDVLVSGDKPEARDVVIGLARAIGLKAWHAGPLDNSAAAEALTSVLIQINKKYGFKGAGIKIVGDT